MNTRMSLVLVASMLGASLGPDATAQERPQAHGQVRPIMPPGPGIPEAKVSISFPGGSAADYAEAVQQASGLKRVVVMPGCEAFLMPAVELEGVSLYGALTPLEVARSAAGEVGLEVSSANDVFIVFPTASARSRSLETHVFSLAEPLEAGQVRAEDVLTAVETALDMGDGADTSIRYHPETRLLMVRGTPDAIESVQRVLNGVMESASVLRQGARAAEELQRRTEELAAAVAAAKKEVEQISNYAKQVEELAAKGEAGPHEVFKAREQLIARERRLAELEAEHQGLRERAEAEKAAHNREKAGQRR